MPHFPLLKVSPPPLPVPITDPTYFAAVYRNKHDVPTALGVNIVQDYRITVMGEEAARQLMVQNGEIRDLFIYDYTQKQTHPFSTLIHVSPRLKPMTIFLSWRDLGKSFKLPKKTDAHPHLKGNGPCSPR